MRALAVLIGAMAVVVGCGEATISGTPSPKATAAAPATPLPSPTDFFAEAAIGPWRPRPLPPPHGFADRVDVTCRAAEPAIGQRTRVVVDLRGKNRLLFIFADSSSAFACYAPADATLASDVTAFPLEVPPEPIGESAIDVVRYEIVQGEGEEAYSVLIGRVGLRAFRVLAGFADESEVEGAKGGGWYAMWWPGPTQFDGVAAVDQRNIVMGDAPAVPPGS
jgi:hypothetical protein